MKIRTYSELIRLPTFEERLAYASVPGQVGEVTFGGHRVLNQAFYRSREWKRVREIVIVRDNGCDLAIPERPIFDKIIIHHLNPIVIEDLNGDYPESILDPELMICVSDRTHNILHYGTVAAEPRLDGQRFQHDTCPWKL